MHNVTDHKKSMQSAPYQAFFREEYSSSPSYKCERSTSDVGHSKLPASVTPTGMPLSMLNCTDTTHNQTLQEKEKCNTPSMRMLEDVCDNRDFLDDIDHQLHYQLDVEIEQFRSNLHNILSQRQEGSKQMSPLQTVPQFFGSQENSSDCHQSSSSLTDLMKMEESLTSASSLHDLEEELSMTNYQDSQIQLDSKINGLMIQLQTSLSVLSNNLTREEYAT